MHHKTSRDSTRLEPTYYLDDRRTATRRGRLFRVLSDGAWHGADELARVGGISFHASLHQFRRAGWRVESERHGRHWTYRITGRAEDGGTG